MSNKWYLGLAAAGLLGAGAVAGAGTVGVLAYGQHSDAVAIMDDEFDFDGFDLDGDREDNKDEVRAYSQLTTKIDFQTALDTALKEAGSGFVTSVSLDSDNGKARYEVEVLDGQTEKNYVLDANSGDILTSSMDKDIDGDDKQVSQPQKSVTDIISATQSKYSSAKIAEVALDQDSSGKWVYEVDFLDGDTFKTATFETDTANFINEVTDQN